MDAVWWWLGMFHRALINNPCVPYGICSWVMNWVSNFLWCSCLWFVYINNIFFIISHVQISSEILLLSLLENMLCLLSLTFSLNHKSASSSSGCMTQELYIPIKIKILPHLDVPETHAITSTSHIHSTIQSIQ